MHLNKTQAKVLVKAICSAIVNEEEFIACHFVAGHCIDPPLVKKTQRFIEEMKRLRANLSASIREQSDAKRR